MRAAAPDDGNPKQTGAAAPGSACWVAHDKKAGRRQKGVIQREHPHAEGFMIVHEIVLRLDGALDLVAVRQVEAMLALLRPGAALLIDLSRVVEFQDLGVAQLAEVLRAGGRAGRVVVRGLRRHHLRLLGYLGVTVDATGAVAET
jgi:hypothetical protein